MPQLVPLSRRARPIALLAATLITLPTRGFPQVSTPPATAGAAVGPSYADLVDLFLDAPVVAVARIRDAIPVRDTNGAASASGPNRYYIVADVTAVIRGQNGVAPRVAWLADVGRDAQGKAPRLKRAPVIVAAQPVVGNAGELRLAAPDAMLAWSATLQERVRAIVASGLDPAAPPRVTGIAGAFHTAGTLPGEGETQLFLTTSDNRPVSLGVLRRPGQQPSWSVAFGEIVDEAARPPARETLAWYRLACALPPALPPSATTELSADDATAARADYDFVIAALGPCGRTRR